jgi:hypothetical protein
VKQASWQFGVGSSPFGHLPENAASTQCGPFKGPRPHARRLTAQVAVTACCAAVLSATIAATPASAITTPVYVATVNASDTMNRTVAGGFGTPTLGGTYLTSPAPKFSVSGGAGHITAIPTATAVRATLSAAKPADEQVQSTFSLPAMPVNGRGIYYQLEFRRQANGDAYRVQLRVAPGGAMTLGFNQTRATVQKPVGLQSVAPQLAGARRTIVLQGLVAGSSAVALRARVWIAGTPVPGWQLAATDSTATRATAAGQIGMNATMSSTTSAMPVSVAGLVGWALTAPKVVAPLKPGPTNTGVPAGTKLTQHQGDMVITTPGATYDALDIHGFVTIRAANVTIKRSIIRGGVAGTSNVGIVTDIDPAGTNFQLLDSELVPEHPSVAIDGIKGGNYVLTRINIHGTVDGAKVFGNNATIQHSWVHDTVAYAHDPYQGNGPSHNDGVQVLSGRTINIRGNTIQGGSNSALQVTQGNGAVSALSFSGNWADGGACTVNVADAPLATMSGINVSYNQFGHTSYYKNCAIIVSAGVSMTAISNVWAGTTSPVAITPRG